MNGFYSILLGSFLISIIALIIALIPMWSNSEKKPTRSSLAKRIVFAIIFIFLITLLWSYTQYSEPSLPNGIENGLTNTKAALNNKGVALYKQQNYTDAIKCYDEAIEIDPEYVLAWSNKGDALKALNRDTEAERAFANARKARGEIR
jgi:tetratricopeptide (TPR) repeat protein